MSQMIENNPSGKEVCIVCEKGLIKIHRVSQDGPPKPNSQHVFLPWRDVTFEQEGIIKKMFIRSVSGLNQHETVREIQECHVHGDAFKTGACAPHWCSECRILFKICSRQKPRSTKMMRLQSLPDAINNEIPELPKVFQFINGHNFPAVTTELYPAAKVTATTGFHIPVGPAPDTSLPSCLGECPDVRSYYPTSLSPIEGLCDEVEKGSIQLIEILDESQLPHDPTYVRKLRRSMVDGYDQYIVEAHYGGATPFEYSSRKRILQMIDTKIQKLRCDVHNLAVNLNSLIDTRHNHGIETGDKATCVKEVGALVGFLLHTQSPITEYNFYDYLTERCPDLCKAERTEARAIYALVFQLLKAQSLFFHGRYTASAIEGASCFEMIVGDQIVKTDRFDPLKLTEVANSTISFVPRVRDQVRSLTNDLVFPCSKPTARPVTQPKVDVVKAEAPIETRDEMQDDDTMGADYEQDGTEPDDEGT